MLGTIGENSVTDHRYKRDVRLSFIKAAKRD